MIGQLFTKASAGAFLSVALSLVDLRAATFEEGKQLFEARRCAEAEIVLRELVGPDWNAQSRDSERSS
jgi:hypothetical protein